MNELDLLRELGARAAHEPAPPLDVSARVLGSIVRRRPRGTERRLAVACVIACSLAALAAWTTFRTEPAPDSVAALSEAAAGDTGPEFLFGVVGP